MNQSLQIMMASTVAATSITLMSCAETAAVNDPATQTSQVLAAKNAKVETVQLVLTGLT